MAADFAFQNVSVEYVRRLGFRRHERVQALDDVSLDVPAGSCVGVIGESGSGKSTLAGVGVGLVEPTAGFVRLGDTRLAPGCGARPASAKRAIQIVFQDPYGSLNPTMTIGAIVCEGLAIHGIGTSSDRRERAASLLSEVGLNSDYMDRRPHELSGGQRQRVSIARALAVDPEILILDEPTSALDLSVQAQILNLLLDLQDRRGLSYVLISHDIDVVRHMCHRVTVLCRGQVVEEGAAAEVIDAPSEPYTRRLVAAVPRLAVEARS